MTALGRLLRFDLRFSNGRIQRAPAVTAAPSKVGKLIRQQPLAGTMVGAIRPVSGPHSGQPSEGKLDGGEGDKRGQGFDEVLKVLGKPPRLRPNHEKVRSTTQRRGSTTKPFVSSLRLTISRRSGGTFATAASTCHAL